MVRFPMKPVAIALLGSGRFELPATQCGTVASTTKKL
jgi:hypothetical protein